MDFNTIVKDIKTLKIQGAEAVAKASILALKDIIRKSKAATKYKLVEELKHAKKILIETRPTEPCMRNTLKHILTNLDVKDIISLKALLDERIKKAQEHFSKTEQTISAIGAKKIKNGMIIFTHCHSSIVINILNAELSKANIPVTIFVDSAARIALKKADLFLFGADAITSEGKVINKIGTELFAEVSNRYDIPTYSCTDSWKFDPKTIFGLEEKIEKRSLREIWRSPPKQVKISNPAFERVKSELITGIISELGIYRPSMFIETVKEAYPWMF